MAKPFRILVPVEFSSRCQGAVQYAEALARRFPSEILLLHVVQSPAGYFDGGDSASFYWSEEFSRDLEAARSEELAAFPCEAPESGSVRRLVLRGDPAAVIVDTAAAEACDLIVMPTHGYGPFRRFLLGSVTAKILHDACCPVWTGPHMEDAPQPSLITFRRVLCAVDLGAHTRQLLCWAGTFAARFGAEVAMLHSIPLAETRIGPLYFDPDWRLKLAHDARERMEFFKTDLGLRAEIMVDTGEVGPVVRDNATKWRADLVVIGRGRAAQAHPRLPTHSYAIVRESPCPVVST